MFNPIIPVFQEPPSEWEATRINPAGIVDGYIRFFEPDVFVEAEEGLAEQAGVAPIPGQRLPEQGAVPTPIPTLAKFMVAHGYEGLAVPYFGLSVAPILCHLYEREQKFALRTERKSIVVQPDTAGACVEALFGVYPEDRSCGYLAQGFIDVFCPETVGPSADAWLSVFRDSAQTPLRMTSEYLRCRRYWGDKILVYIFDPTRSTDLIDLWNMRQEHRPLLPVPLNWLDMLSGHVPEIVNAFHVNPPASMSKSARELACEIQVETSRSVPRDRADEIATDLKNKWLENSMRLKPFRNAVWDCRSYRTHENARLHVTAEQKDVLLDVDVQSFRSATFAALSPAFATESIYASSWSWVNTVRFPRNTDSLASVLPFNTFDRTWPRLSAGSPVSIGSEGWVFERNSWSAIQTLSLLSKEEALAGSLRSFGIEARLSDAGHVARQVLEHLGGLAPHADLLAHEETIKLLNEMAGGVRRRSNDEEVIEETFPPRNRKSTCWAALIKKRNSAAPWAQVKLADFTERNVLRLGIQTQCPHCSNYNWHSLTAVDYRITCERCLKWYDFPQDMEKPHGKWFYRVVGPFSVPDFARGSYATILTLRSLRKFMGYWEEMTFSTSMCAKINGKEREVDFVAWCGRRYDGDLLEPPRLVVGEAKSFGDSPLLSAGDIAGLKRVGELVPRAILVVSVLRNEFLPQEKDVLVKLAEWGRRDGGTGEVPNPVVLLTSKELFDVGHPQLNKEQASEVLKKVDTSQGIYGLADITQQVYLGLSSFDEWQRDWLETKRAERKR